MMQSFAIETNLIQKTNKLRVNQNIMRTMIMKKKILNLMITLIPLQKILKERKGGEDPPNPNVINSLNL